VTRRGREGGGFGEIGLVSVLRDAEAFGGAVRTRGFGLCGLGLRRLFDNFIGRKRDVDGGVLAGLSCFETLGC
jgi:hypothetical protein